MFSRFKPKNDLFYDLFNSSAQCLASGTKTLTQLLAPEPDVTQTARLMVELEHDCDRITHELFRTLNSSFITPFDRSDIYLLGSCLDDVMDHMEAATHLMVLYGVSELPRHLQEMIVNLDTCAAVTAEAMPRLARLNDLEKYWIEINELENRADHTYRTFLAHLFDGHLDALTVMKLKDVADEFEDAADSFEKISHFVEAIVLKES
ncbi:MULTISPECIES: DUF47 domain-containing protein [unclassified Gordonia (in: high G+C Gram-positive bacteria)]|uniref:DUF47 domain-containing protein n=1 Tax=unclassified Gordonia (in: high G+C Gram-positive bacteria) TaxID=2657482 RepID=UPI000990A818|nr:MULTISPECIES: DUF47 family protein [unclassified Gordonia (in: high G+C Gram-positive bacteria)]MCX2755046.1 DUF47 family protein [Gordonia sp. 4N]